jgi:hypothetical protein
MGYFNHAWALVHTVLDEAGDKFKDATILLQGGGRADDDEDEDEDDADDDDLDLEPASQHKGAGMKRLANVDGSALGSDELSVRKSSEVGSDSPKVVKKAKASSESPKVIEKAASNKADAAAKKSKVNSKTKKRSTNKDEDIDGSAQGSDELSLVRESSEIGSKVVKKKTKASSESPRAPSNKEDAMAKKSKVSSKKQSKAKDKGGHGK